ncbi:MAG: ABC transporter permease subunit, partial [Anaerolineaceae bacterium]|nr:ABC transporter permease subunit [Anaerolineaceae bacterium]
MKGQIFARVLRFFQKYAPSITLAVGVLVFWEVVVTVFAIQQFLLPKPSAILTEYLNELRLFLDPTGASLLFEASGATLREAIGGFVIGCGSGIGIALLTARWTAVNQALMPFAIAANSVPIIAFAPIMNNWFGITNPFSKMAIVSIIVFFPTMINTVRGLTLIDPNQLELMHSYAASPMRIMR